MLGSVLYCKFAENLFLIDTICCSFGESDILRIECKIVTTILRVQTLSYEWVGEGQIGTIRKCKASPEIGELGDGAEGAKVAELWRCKEDYTQATVRSIFGVSWLNK